MDEKVYAWEIIDSLSYEEPKTAKELAEEFSVCEQTIRHKINKECRKNKNIIIIHGLQGYLKVNAKSIKDSFSTARDMQYFANWINGILISMANSATPINNLLPDMKKTLATQLDTTQQDALIELCANIIAFVAFSKANTE